MLVVAVVRDLIRIGFRTRSAFIAENLFPRRQLPHYHERKRRRHWLTPATKLILVVLGRCFPWKSGLAPLSNRAHLFVGIELGFRLLWRWKSRAVGRPPLPKNLKASIVGPSTSAAIVLINRNAATVYAEAVRAIKQRGYTQITNPDDARYFVEVTRNGKSATLQVDLVGSDQSRIIITIENDKQARDIN